jgi:hypothetical protein
MITALIYGYAESEIAIDSFLRNDERDEAVRCEVGAQSNQLHSFVVENAGDAVSIVYNCWRV